MVTNRFKQNLPVLTHNAAEIVKTIMQQDRRVLLFGPPGIGKSTLLAQLADELNKLNRAYCCLSVDPGSPAFGIPGAVSLGKRHNASWQFSAYAALCSLDAGRFRLPLVSAVRSLVAQVPDGIVLIDAPGVVRGVAAPELLEGLIEATEVDVVLALTAVDRPPALLDELRALNKKVFMIHAVAEARRPGKRTRARQRTEQWDAFLSNNIEQTIDLAKVSIIGTPPPLEESHTWIGRQIALLQDNRTLAMGEVQHVQTNELIVTCSVEVTNADTLLIRDAVRSPDGFIETATPYAAERFDYLPPSDMLPSTQINNGPRIIGRVGAVDVNLVNGVFGDPLLLLRVRHQRRSLLFDLGEGMRLSARIAHQVSDVFISHAHMDHIGGFLWLLRARIGDYPACRLYGPPGLAQHIAGFLQGILWDRVDDCGPSFEVTEIHDNRIQRFHLQAGYNEWQLLDELELKNGVLLKEAGFCVRGVTLDHHGTHVIAYAFEADKQINIRKDRLKARGLEPGPWLTELKQQLLSENGTTLIQLPDGSTATARDLATELTIITPGKKLVYATDLADTPENRQHLIRLAQNAHTLFCEATFVAADADHAKRNGHLTTHACGEIATEARVSRLVAFHFSRRYADNPQQIYDELQSVCTRVVAPKSMAIFEATTAAEKEPLNTCS